MSQDRARQATDRHVQRCRRLLELGAVGAAHADHDLLGERLAAAQIWQIPDGDRCGGVHVMMVCLCMPRHQSTSQRARVSHGAGRLLVIDRRGLGVLLQRAVRERFGGSQRRAARELARTLTRRPANLQRAIARLVRGKIGAITEQTLEVLIALVGPEHQDELRQALLPQAARNRLARYRWWMERTLARTPGTEHLARRLRHVPSPPQLPADVSRLSPEVLKKARELLHRRRPNPDHALIETLFRDFDTFLERIGCIAPRAEIAFRDVLAPLTRDGPTGQIERGASELSPGELRRYLAHAFAAQRVLLHRASDMTRAMEAAGAAEMEATWAAEIREKVGRQVHSHERRRRPPRLGWRVTGEPKREPPVRLARREMEQRLSSTPASKKWKVLGQYVSAEVDRPRPRRHVLEWLTTVIEPVEQQLPESFRRSPFYLPLTGELKAALESDVLHHVHAGKAKRTKRARSR
ncbi:MAG: hypothetical protein ACREX3_03060 [Gammaproteobacteria bacterium]